MSYDPNKIAEYCARFEAMIPTRAWKSTVVIVRAEQQAVIQVGTGTLFRIADKSFVITAAHVTRAAAELNQTIGVSGGETNFVALSEPAICSDDRRLSFTEDSFDVAVMPLTHEQTSRLEGSTFLRFDDVSFDSVDKENFLCILGFPHMWSSRSTEQLPTMTSKAFQFTTDVYSGDTSDLGNYSEQFHLLLNGSNCHLYDKQGNPIQFQTSESHLAMFPSDLSGISGCSVWNIADSRKPLSGWDSNQGKLIAVQTGTYRKGQIIKSTRWIGVSTLLHEAFPELRGAMGLLRPY